MELIVGYAILWGLSWLAAIVVVLFMGGIFDLAIPSIGGAIWRCAILAAASVGGTIGWNYLNVPIPFGSFLAPAICAAIALSILFDMEFPEEAGSIAGFVVAYALAQVLIGVLATAIASSVGNSQAAAPSSDCPGPPHLAVV